LWRPYDHGGRVHSDPAFLDQLGLAESAGLVGIGTACARGCTILLGAPGAGKTTELQRFLDDRRLDTTVQVIELRGFGDEQRLLDEVVSGPAGRALRDHDVDHALLAFDSLDECPLGMGHLAELIKQALARLPGGLQLVVACRTAAWPPALETDIRNRFPDIGIYEIAPLMARQIAVLAEAADLDSGAFAAAVAAARVQPLTGNPNTLRLLLADAIAQAGVEPLRLPGTQLDLFDRACQRLASEPNPYRRATAPPHSPRELVAVAGYLATVALFSGASAFWLDPFEDAPPGTLALPDLVPATVVWSDQDGPVAGPLPVEVPLVRDVLGTALFAGQGEQRVGFAHQTLAEFLAARHLVASAVPERQVSALLRGRRGHLAPQVQAVATWLVALAPDRYQQLLTDDPAAFIQSAVELVDTDYRRVLVESLLDLAGRHQLPDVYGLPLTGLDYPGLAETLRAVLPDQKASVDARLLSVLLARANHLASLASPLLALALDTDAPTPLRSIAGHVVLELGDRSTRAQVATLADTERDDDPDDELLGLGLSAAVGLGTPLDELLQRLRAPNNPDLFGNYRLVLIDELPARLADPGLDPQQLGATLTWAAGIERRASDRPPADPAAAALLSAAEPLFDAVLRAGWNRAAQEPALLAPTARLLAVRCTHHYTVVHGRRTQLPALPADQRRLLLAAVRVELRALGADPGEVYHALGTLLLRDDLAWLIRSSLEATDPTEAADWALYVRWVFDPTDPAHVRQALDVPTDTALYREAFAAWREEIPLGSERAALLRRVHDRQAREPEGPTEADLRHRLTTELAQPRDDDTFTRLCRWLLFAPGERHSHQTLELDVTALPGWALLDDHQRAKAAELARQHLQHADVDPAAYLGTNTVGFRELAGVRALVLLCHTLGQTPSLPPARWATWATAIVGAPVGSSEQALLEEATRLAYRHAPDAVLAAAEVLARQADQHGGFVLQRIGPVLDKAASPWLAALASDPDVERDSAAAALRLLIQQDPDAAIPVLRATLNRLQATSTPWRDRAEDAAATALGIDPAGTWEPIWAAAQADTAFGDAVLLRLAHDRDLAIRALSEDRLVDLWRFLHERFPPSEDPVVHGAHFVSPRESIAELRSRLLPELAQRGTDQAVALLRRLADQHPAMPQLARLTVDAEHAARRGDWTPLPPRQVVALLAARDRLLVRTSQDLLDVVLDALRTIQQDLRHSAPPQATLLWNHVPGCRPQGDLGCRPKTEDEVSDYLKPQLERLLQAPVVNREVQVQRRRTRGLGERVDLLVQLLVHAQARTAPHDLVQVAIEVKGCWNGEVLTAIDEQLVPRYLDNLPGSAGLLLVAWFDPDHWQQPGPWVRHPLRGHRDKLAEALQDQADQAAASSGYAIGIEILDCSMPS
jgi:hypothetical protein